jgi:hypothetical protein
MSSATTPSSGGLTIFSLSGELRNKIYRAYFDELHDAGIFGHPRDSVPATAVRSFLNLFEVSQAVYAETHALFFTEYFPQTRYNLSGLRAMQAFVNLPSEWRNAFHMLKLRSRDPDVGLKYLSTIEAVLGGTAGFETQSWRTVVSFQDPEVPLEPVEIDFRTSWDQDWEQLALSVPIHFPKDRGARMRHLPYAFMEATVHRRIFNSGDLVVIATVVDNVGNTEWKFRGNLSKLDWSHVPKDVRVFVDKPVGDAITDEAEKAVRIIKGLQNAEVGRGVAVSDQKTYG